MRAGMMFVVAACVLLAGCATGPYTPMNAGTLKKGEKVVYFEQADRIPKDVMLEAWKHVPVAAPVANAQAIPPEVIAAIVKEVLATIPQVTGGYQKERMNEALLSRRMLFRGYAGEELKDINDIVKSLGWSIEYMTPQGKEVPPPSVR